MEHTPPPLFNQGPSARVRLLFFVLLSLGLLVLDARTNSLEMVRKAIGAALYPLQQTSDIPVSLVENVLEYFASLDNLRTENERLQKLQLENHQKLNSLSLLQKENDKLRKLMNVGSVLQVKGAILTEVVSDANDPFSRKIIVGKGSIHGINAGMPVIDELGLLGQVTRTYPGRSEVSLVTDKDQIIPVENLRNGLRSVAYGGLDGGLLELRFMAANADIRDQDLLVTSGLDGVYPRGIPVARVIRVERNSRYAFASIFCEPIAGVERHRFLLALDTVRTPEPEGLPAPATTPTQPENDNGN
ncbi:MAG: rod shape-determining protein MreC [Limnobacter sp.]|nr:rod shape-determining protein MreC [Limnobacter sp.]